MLGRDEPRSEFDDSSTEGRSNFDNWASIDDGASLFVRCARLSRFPLLDPIQCVSFHALSRLQTTQIVLPDVTLRNDIVTNLMATSV